jgi:hypothetical protein
MNPVKAYLSRIGRKGGQTTGPTKARTKAQARKAAKARWAKAKRRAMGKTPTQTNV